MTCPKKLIQLLEAGRVGQIANETNQLVHRLKHGL